MANLGLVGGAVWQSKISFCAKLNLVNFIQLSRIGQTGRGTKVDALRMNSVCTLDLVLRMYSECTQDALRTHSGFT